MIRETSCIFDWFGYDLPLPERYRLIRDAGFQQVMLWWGDEFSETQGDKSTYPALARQVGLEVNSVHFSYYQAGQIWEDSDQGRALTDRYCWWIEACGRLEIPTVVLHVSGKGLVQTGRLGLERYRQMTEQAEAAGVVLALENTLHLEPLYYLLDRIQSSHLAFCLDSGHAHIQGETFSLLEKYGHRLRALHLHDNHGERDEHLLPGEGTLAWESLIKQIGRSGYEGPLSLEVAKPYPPTDTETASAYLARAYERAQGLLKLK